MSNRLNQLSTIGLICTLLGIGVVQAADYKVGVTHLNQSEFQIKSAEPDSVVIDIRTIEEFNTGHIKGSKHIPLRSILQNPSLLEKFRGKDLILYCHVGVRVKHHTDNLQHIGHPAQDRLFHLKGDIRA
jgi:rhodanese-related sulfurtransferase